MKSSVKIAAAVAAALCLVSCGGKVHVSGTVEGLGEGDSIVAEQLDINTFEVLDTISIKDGGRFSFQVDVPSGEPAFVYLFRGGTKLASLLLFAGDKVEVSADSLGNYSVEGSPESMLLQEVERSHAEFSRSFPKVVEKGDGTAVAKAYVDYYKSCVTFVMNNPKSLTCIPVLYQQVSDNMPVFSQPTDAIHFRRVCDSLKTVYPDSKYVKTLEKETVKREGWLQLYARVDGAEEVGYPDITLPDQNGQKVALSSLGNKVVLLHFWSAADATHKMFNLDVLKPLYEKYAGKGLGIYAVSVDVDKAVWASTVKNQELPWTNVCDGLGGASQVLNIYNVQAVPQSYLIVDGALWSGGALSGEKEIAAALAEVLK